MTEPNEPDKKVEAAEPTEDEPIIDLIDEAAVEPADDEEAIKGDEEIIDLTDAVETKEPTEDEAPIALEEEVVEETKGDEEIIDLMDAAEEIPLTQDTEKIDDDVSESVEDEAVVDLIETVDDDALEVEDIGEPIPDATETAQEFEDISGLDDDLIKEVTDFTDESDSETIAGEGLKPDFTDSLGIEMGPEEDSTANLIDPDKVSGEQVEAALERVIKKMFYEKIDRLLVDTIEKTVTKEIEKLKKALLDGATDSE